MSPVPGSRRLRRAALWLAIVVLAGIAAAQTTNNSQQQDSQRGFFDSIAKATYNMAWPTAVYKSWSFAMPVTDADGGIDVVVKLSGLSGFDGSDLWLKLGFAFRAGKLDHVAVVEHNAILMPPFKTMEVFARLGAQLAQQYAQANPAPAPAAPAAPAEPAPATPAAASGTAMAICVRNRINTNLVYTYRWGEGDWSKEQLEAGESMLYWYTLDAGHPAEPPFYIEYDDSFEDGYTPQRYELKRQAVSLPATCDTARQYTFTASVMHVLLNSTN